MSDAPVDTPGSVWSRDRIAGAIFIALAIAFAIEATSYDMGRLIRMGPGFIPLVLALMLGALGAAVALAGSASQTGDLPSRPIPWRGILLISVALILFGAYGRTLGLVPVVFVVGLITALASRRNGLLAATAIAGVIAGLCWLVFKVGLSVALPTVGPIFGPLAIP